MQIHSLELEDAKSYKRVRIDFSHGVNAIVGHNGAGKSTILEAIGFALFDSLAYKQTEFVREGAKTATVTVVFESSLDQRAYRVVRRCGGSNQHLVFDPELELKLCEGKADVLRFLRQHMGIEPTGDLDRLFKDAVGVPQGTLTAAFLLTASDRKAIFDRLLRVEEYSKAAERLREPVRTLAERKQKLDVAIAALAAHLERLPQLEEAVCQRRQQIAASGLQIAQAEEALAVVEKQRQELEVQRQLLINLRNRQSQNIQMLQTLQRQHENAVRALEQAEAAHHAVEAHKAGYARYLVVQTEQKELESQARQQQQVERVRSDLDKTLALRQSELHQLSRELEEVTAAEQVLATLAPALQQQEQLEQTLAGLQQEMARLDGAKAVIMRQEQELARLHAHASELANQRSQAVTLETRIHESETKLAQLRLGVDSHRDKLASCKNAAEVIKRQNEALRELSTSKCPVCEQNLTEEGRSALLARNKERLQDLRAEYKQLEAQRNADEAAFVAQQASLQQIQKQLLRLARPEELEQLGRQRVIVEAELAQARSQVDQLVQTPEQIEIVRNELAGLDNPRQQQAIAGAVSQRKPALEERRQQLARESADVQQQLDVCLEQLEQFAGLDLKLETVSTELRSLETAYQAVLSNRLVAETVNTRREELATVGQALLVVEEEGAQIHRELASATGRFDEGAYHRTVAEEQQLRSQLGGLQTQLTIYRQEQEREQQMIAQLKAREIELDALHTQKRQLDEHSTVLDAMRDLLRQAGPQVTKALIQRVGASADQIFCDLMHDHTRRLQWNEDYGVTLESSGYERQFAQLSGGEQMSAALAVRLALLREMSNIDIAFFDEPTTNLDETRRDALVRQILDVKGFRQLFVISHDDTFEQATQNLIRVERVNGGSQILNAESPVEVG
jgi:exonuclease SbcC